MTLSDPRVIKFLNGSFVCGWRNIKGKTSYAGSSNTHDPGYKAKAVSNSSGHHNVQMFFMTGDARVIHCLPGFWSSKHFLHEAELARSLGKLFYRKNMSAAKRNEKFLNLHLEHALDHDAALRRASQLQGFDKRNIQKRKQSDFKRNKGYIDTGLKTADQVMHERMAALPFTPIEKFDIAEYIDMGRKQYKYNYGVPGKEYKHEKKPASNGKPYKKK